MAGSNPLSQFEIKKWEELSLFGVDVSFTNSSFFMIVAASLVLLTLYFGMRKASLVPGRMQSLVECMYSFVANMVRDNVGNAGRPYFPFIFSIFMFVMFCNLVGMLPYSFTVTSHIAVTFALAMFIFIGVTVIGFIKHGTHFFKLLLPEGTPMVMAPLMVLIELVAYLARPISLSIRLAANMLAGHTMLKVIAGFILPLGIVMGVAPFALLIILIGFEIFVALLQAYIFAVLTCVYLNDAIHMH